MRFLFGFVVLGCLLITRIECDANQDMNNDRRRDLRMENNNNNNQQGEDDVDNYAENIINFLGNNVHRHGPDMDKLLKGQIKLAKANPQKSKTFSLEGFWTSFAMILVSEIGDKTFFIAAILAMKHSRFIIWLGSASALVIMTILAVVAGSLLQVIPVAFTHYGAALLFLLFGVKLLWEARSMKGGEASDELREAEEELMEAEKKEKEKAEKEKEKCTKRKNATAFDVELGDNSSQGSSISTNDRSSNKNNDIQENSPSLKGKRLRDRSWDFSVLVRAFAMTFISEIGDRSQITTIVLASHKSPFGVTIGASIGHAICTAVAVLGGKVLASRISEKNVTLIGGCLFLAFSLESLIYGPLG